MSKRTFRTLALATTLTVGFSLPTASAAPFDTVDVRSETQLATYQKVYIAPVAISLDEPATNLLSQRSRSQNIASQRPVSAEAQTRKSDDLHADLTRTFSKDFVVVDAPGADVLTVSAEITRLIPSRPTPEERKRGVGSPVFANSVSPGGVDYNVQISSGSEEAIIQIEESSRSSLNDGYARINVWHDVDRSFDRFSRQLAKFVKSN